MLMLEFRFSSADRGPEAGAGKEVLLGVERGHPHRQGLPLQRPYDHPIVHLLTKVKTVVIPGSNPNHF